MRTVTIRTFDEYCSYIEKFKNNAYFRGQADSSWPITPSLFRQTGSTTLEDEQQQVKNEMSESGLDALQALFKLQHYGNPTRICDLTISPLSALFFATDGDDQTTKDGVVYLFKKQSEVTLTSKEVNLFSKAITENKLVTDFPVADQKDTEQVLKKNHIIQYSIKFSYTNPRAILQGGTALLFGFSCENGEISQQTDQDVSDLIAERIIIPAASKARILQSLRSLGYSESILYNSLENLADGRSVKFSIISDNAEKKANFWKYNAKIRFDNLYFNRDEFIKKVAQRYDSLFRKFGPNARIWLFFYYDENDVTQGNWLCFTEWKEGIPYRIKWLKNYYQRRMTYINEQPSKKEVVERFSNLLDRIIPIYEEIKQSITQSSKCLPEVINVINTHISEIVEIESLANNIPFGEPDCEKASKLALNFISNVDWIARDMKFFDGRGECTANNNGTHYFLIKSYIAECEKSKDELELFYKYARTC